MERNIKIILAALVIIILVAGVAGLGLFSKKEVKVNEPVVTPTISKEFFTLRVPTPSGTHIPPYNLAEKLGYLDEEGIKLEYTGVIYGGPEAMLAVASGANDATSNVALSATINAIAQGLKLKAVFSTYAISPNRKSTYFVLNNSGIFTAKDVGGKKFAVNTLGANQDYTIQEYLKQNGMTKEGDNVQLIVIGSEATREQAFRQGQVDIVSGDKKFYTFKEGGGVRELFNEYDVFGDMSTCVILLNEKFIKEHPDIVRRFVAANVKAIDWANAHIDDARELNKKILKENGGNPELANYWEGLGAREHGLVAEKDYRYWIDKFVESGKLKPGQIALSDIYTNEFNPYYKK